MGLGYGGNLGQSRFGAYADLVERTGGDVAEAKWLELGVGVATGTYNGLNGFVFEYNLLRRPEVLAADGSKYTALPEKISHYLSMELNSPYFSLLKLNQFHLSLFKSVEKEIDSYSDTGKDTTGYQVKFGGDFYFGLAYSLGLKMEKIDSDRSYEGQTVLISLSWIGRGAGAGGADAESSGEEVSLE